MPKLGRIWYRGRQTHVAVMADEEGGIGAANASEEVLSGDSTEVYKPSDEQNVEDATKKLQALALKQKIDLLLKATGDAPIMKQKKWTVEADRKIGSIILFIKKYLKLEPSDSLFVYVNQAFAPSPDQLLRNLYECFGTDGKLVLHYCRTQAWG